VVWPFQHQTLRIQMSALYFDHPLTLVYVCQLLTVTLNFVLPLQFFPHTELTLLCSELGTHEPTALVAVLHMPKLILFSLWRGAP